MVGTGDLHLAFQHEGGWGKLKTAPLVLKHKIEGWWWGLGTSVSHFDVREGGDGRVSI